jgi:hypothetical protein
MLGLALGYWIVKFKPANQRVKKSKYCYTLQSMQIGDFKIFQELHFMKLAERCVLFQLTSRFYKLCKKFGF